MKFQSVPDWKMWEKTGRVDVKLDVETELRGLGLAPKTWPETLEALKAKLAKPDMDAFTRLHRNFTGYRSETTLSRFYGFVFSHGLQMDVNAYRFGRLKAILTDLAAELKPGLAILDVGAGAGIIASIVRRNFEPLTYVVQDPCREARDELTAQGFKALPHPVPPSSEASGFGAARGFDLLLCIDSLGEVNGDDDGLLAKPDGVDPAELPDLLEQRYGFAQKLALWKTWLAPGGRILLWEPFAYQNAMESLAQLLRNEGWDADLRTRTPGRNYLELRPI